MSKNTQDDQDKVEKLTISTGVCTVTATTAALHRADLL